jgi:hypothetical protein
MVPTRLASRIDAVTVFVRGALVTRHADLASLDGRPDRVRLTGLPLCLEDSSLRVSIAGGAATASAVQVALDVPPADAALPPPDDAELIAARRAVAEGQVRCDALDAQAARLEQLEILERPAPQRGAPPAPSPTAARLELIAFASRRAEALAADRAVAAEAQRLAQERLAELEARAAAASSARQARSTELRKSAVVTLRWNGDGAPSGAVTVEYRVPGARWMPTYVVRFDAAMGKATVQLRAALAQSSGEDWTNVRLAVSTADSIAWHALPELASRRIGRSRSRPPAIGWRAAPAGADGLYADYDASRLAVAAIGGVEGGGGMTDDADDAIAAIAEESAEKERSIPRPSPKKAGSLALGRAGAGKAMADLSEIAAPPPPGAAPAMSMSMSAPAPVMMDRMRSSKRRAQEEASPEQDFGSAGGGGPGSPPSEPEGGELDPAAWLDFGNLRLGGPADPHRGHLRKARLSETYLSLLVEQRVTLTASVREVLRAADARAQVPQHLPPAAAHAVAPEAGRFAHVHQADLPLSVASDGAWHVVPIAEHTATVELGHVCVPREAREVFRTARFANPFPTPLSAGPADCYAGERFLMTVPLAGIDTGGMVTIGLGVEPGIAVARNTSVAERSAGMLGGTLNVDHRIRIRVANKLQRAVAIEVRERIPVSRADDCVVKAGEVKPPWSAYDQPESPIAGGHRWQLTVAPAAEVELAADYTVTFPSKHEIAGGNRREGA